MTEAGLLNPHAVIQDDGTAKGMLYILHVCTASSDHVLVIYGSASIYGTVPEVPTIRPECDNVRAQNYKHGVMVGQTRTKMYTPILAQPPST